MLDFFKLFRDATIAWLSLQLRRQEMYWKPFLVIACCVDLTFQFSRILGTTKLVLITYILYIVTVSVKICETCRHSWPGWDKIEQQRSKCLNSNHAAYQIIQVISKFTQIYLSLLICFVGYSLMTNNTTK